ncbi:MAG: indole-3-glycerol phosphate synthase [Gemmatimonadota bacterium]|nr:MAG: indole-3-glycerol phosphate synthase [Gemmatimonadota bacterium]
MNVLDRIVAQVGERLLERQRAEPLAAVRARAEAAPNPPAFAEALRQPGTSLIAEAKQASPSRGVLRADYDPAALARTYEAGGARAMSVLTEPDFFRGAPDHLRAARAACRLPLLRKDFLTDPYQLWEAREWGASAVLLIVAVLETARLRDLVAQASDLGLDALVEVHSEPEVERALEASARIVGINNRDLTTFETDLQTTGRLAGRLPAEVLVVAESGIFTREHVLEVERAGASAVLVGEALVAEADPSARIAELLGRGREGE